MTATPDRIAQLRATTPPATCPRTTDGQHTWQPALSPNPPCCAACNIHQPLADIALLLARITELEAGITWRDKERHQWAEAHALIERAIDKGCTHIETDLLTDALKDGDPT